MALTCARCGAQNPDGNAFCQACGTPLALPAATPAAPPGPPPGPPVGMAPPAFSAGGYQSPYYSPAGATVPMHRAPMMLIVAGVLALVVLMAGFGFAGQRAVIAGADGAGEQDNDRQLPEEHVSGCPRLPQHRGHEHGVQRRQGNLLDDLLHIDERVERHPRRGRALCGRQQQRQCLLHSHGPDAAGQSAELPDRGQACAARRPVEAVLSGGSKGEV